MGDTTMRLGSSIGPTLSGEKRWGTGEHLHGRMRRKESGGENSATRCYSMGPCPSTAHCRQFGAPDVLDPMSGVGRRATYAILTLLGPVLTILGPGGAMRDAECRIDARSMPDGCPPL